MRLSVLDQTPVSEGSTSAEALRNSIDLARLAERLGYHRYWVAEHHGGGLVAGPSPEVLIGPIAAATSRMRIGSGGVMLPHYSPLKVAESFGVLAGLFPGRIDLGIGRAAGTDPMTTRSLQRDRSQPMPDDFPEQLAELLAYLERSFPADHPLARLAENLPGEPEVPEPWLLGSSEQSALWAGELGLRYAFADFINPRGGADRRDLPATASTPASALPSRRWRSPCGRSSPTPRRRRSGSRRAGGWPSTCCAAAAWSRCRRRRKPQRYFELHDGGARGPDGERRRLTGTPAQVRADIEEIVAAYGAEEAIVVTIAHDHEARRRSYELLAAEFGLALRGA